MVFLSVVLVAIVLHSAAAKPLLSENIFKLFKDNEEKPQCGYASCPKPKAGMLNVHIVPHTHDDVGWLKTVDQYYYGSQTLIQKAGVQYILDSVVQELLNDPAKKFIYVESAFFFKWWKEQTQDLQEKVKELVNEGRLEFIGGAWSMNDEATTHYQSIIDQFAWGLRRLNDTFGECGRPKIGWQIDPFGHSREMASIFAHMGYDGLFFGRLDYQDREQRLRTKTPEMIWRASPNLGKSSDLFTGALYNQYQPPPGFCFDILCADEPIIDNKHSPDYNVEQRVNEFFQYVKKMADGYRTNNVLITMGEDFHYQVASMWYKNLDKLIKYANERQANGSDVNLFYSTPSCYLKALHDSGITWPTKDDDFFPYASDPHAYWTGYFTSRPTLKRYERDGNHFLQVCKQLSANSPKKEKQLEPHLSFMRETMGIMQHHDAVTGTEKEKVAQDYAKRIDVGLRACSSNTRAALNRIMTGDDFQEAEDHSSITNFKFDFKTCLLRNISQCDVSEDSDRFMVTLYNPLAHSTYEYIRVPVPSSNYQIMDYRGVPATSQIVPVPRPVRNLRFRTSKVAYELVFLASDLPPMGYKSYFVSKTNDAKDNPIPTRTISMEDPLPNDNTVVGNKYMNLTFDSNGLLSKVSSNGIARDISQDFLFYEGATGDNREFRNRSSGAYIFRPNNTVRLVTKSAKVEVYSGTLVTEVHQTFNEWISQVIRLYEDVNYAEFEWLVGPIPVEDRIGKEVITKFKSNIESNGIFYTDSNGREMIKRKRDHRDTWDVEMKEKVSGNYYPLTTKIALEDDDARMAVLVDRAQGGSSLEDGSIEIMVHRRLLHDDAFGVDEALNETAYGDGLVARGHHYLILGPTQSSSVTTKAQERFVQLKKLLPPWVFLSDVSEYTYSEWRENYKNIFSGISLSLPLSVHFMTLEPWHDNELLVRFEHILEKDEDPQYSKPVKFNLKEVLRNLKIADIQEMTLDGNLLLSKSQRLTFNPDSEGTTYELVDGDGKFISAGQNQASVESLDDPGTNSKLKSFRMSSETGEELNKLQARVSFEISADGDNLDTEEDDKFMITVNPMQIRTFVLTLEESI